MYLTYLLAVSLLAGAADVFTPPIRVIEEIVAKVNGDIITRGELEQQRRAIEAEIKQQQPNLAGDALANAVRQKQSEALRDKIDPSLNINVDPDVTRRVAQIQQESKIADVEKFHEWVHQQAGVPFEDFKSEMKNQILTQRVIGQEVASKVNVARSEVTDYYNKHKADFVREETVFLREITIKSADNTPQAWAAAEKKAKDVLARARKGEKFSDLAHQYSDADTAKQDGELGRFKRGDLKPDIEALVFKQSKGYVTDLIKTEGGYEILKVDEKFAAGQAAPVAEAANATLAVASQRRPHVNLSANIRIACLRSCGSTPVALVDDGAGLFFVDLFIAIDEDFARLLVHEWLGRVAADDPLL